MNRTVRCRTGTAVLVCAMLSAVDVCRGADAGAGRAVGAPADWPQWRGPERNGLGTGGPVLASAWPAAGPVKLLESEAIPVDAEHCWSTPAVADGRVYLSLAMNLGGQWRNVFFCLDADSGKTLWKKDGGAYVLTVARDGLSAFELRTGKPLWTVLPGCSSVTPVVAGDYAVFLSDAWPKRGLVCFRMSLEKAETAWMVEGRHDAGSSAVVYRGHVYATASNRGESGGYSRAQALCVNLDTGTVAWETKVPCGGYASPLIADGKFFFRAPNQIVMAEATPVAYKELGRATMGVNTYASPIIAGGKLFVRMGGGGWSKGAPGKIACYDLRKQ